MRKLLVDTAHLFRCTLSLISPVLNTKILFFVKNHRKINLTSPESFSEKLQWLKLNRYNSDPLVSQCADKYRVRQFVQEKGCGDILNELYAAYDSVDELRWDQLPRQFALKWNYGAGYNIICKDKNNLDERQVCDQLRKWRKEKPWLGYAELQYKAIPPKLLLEKYLDSGSSAPIPDYKVYCFHGQPKAILVMHDRGSKIKAAFFDTQWNKLDGLKKYIDLPATTPKPVTLKKMVEYAETLSRPFPFVRVDFYEVSGKLVFGEMTFTPSAGFGMAEVEIGGRPMGDYIQWK